VPGADLIDHGILGLAWIVRGPLSLGRVLLARALTLGLLVLPAGAPRPGRRGDRRTVRHPPGDELRRDLPRTLYEQKW